MRRKVLGVVGVVGGVRRILCVSWVFGLSFGVFMLFEDPWNTFFGGFVSSMGSVFFCGWEFSDVISVCLVVSAL